MELRSRKSSEVVNILLKSAEENFDNIDNLSDKGEDYLEKHCSTVSEEEAESDINDSGQIIDPDERQCKKKGRLCKYLRASNFKWLINAPESRGRSIKTEFDTIKAKAKSAAKSVSILLET
ncbi:uncharacterized protein LOC120358181 [Solenopsis invicta]|uniref:uncharacterized protein LOC120358181 n=1 Tax=Solenopsis invicta TaxID=13686 RepID=UPI00193C8DB9|nr:uncharacterized protein LOC120358181 [Solenopsis invicta]